MSNLLVLLIFCSSKLLFIEAESQQILPGRKEASAYINYSFTIANPKEKKITIKSVWADGNDIPETGKVFDGKVIKFTSKLILNRTGKLIDSPIKGSKAKVIISYTVGNKKKIKYLEIDQVKQLPPKANR